MKPLRDQPWFGRFMRVVMYFATHYTGAFLFVMIVTLVSTGFSISYLSSLETNLNNVYENDVKGGDAIQAAYSALLMIEASAKDLVLLPDRRGRDKTKTTLRSQAEALRSAVARAVPRFHTPKAKLAMNNAQGDLKDFLALLDATVATAESKKTFGVTDLAVLDAGGEVLEEDFTLLLANRSANSNIGIGELVWQLRFSLVLTVVIVVVTLGVRFGLYLAGHPERLKRRKDD